MSKIFVEKYYKQLKMIEMGSTTIKDYTGEGSNIKPKELYPDTISLNNMIDDMIRRLVIIKNAVKEKRITLMAPTIHPVNTNTDEGKDQIALNVNDVATIFNPAMSTISSTTWGITNNDRHEDNTNNPKIYQEFSESALFMYLRQSAYTINVVQNASSKAKFNIAFPADGTTAAHGAIPITGKD